MIPSEGTEAHENERARLSLDTIAAVVLWPPRTGPLAWRWMAIGAVVAGMVGGVVGLVIGLDVNPGTAWFAFFELGVPASIVGGLLGVASGAIADAFRKRAATASAAQGRSGATY